jgi:phage gp36-like protein
MPYATLSDVFVRYRPIETMVGTGQYEVTSEEVSSVFIAQSEAYVDAWLARRYVVPVSIQSPLITQVTADLAIFHMMAEKLTSVPEFIDKRKDRADKILEMLAEGKMQISSATTVSTGGDNEAWSANTAYTPIFSPVLPDNLQRVDQDRVGYDADVRWPTGAIEDGQ